MEGAGRASQAGSLVQDVAVPEQMEFLSGNGEPSAQTIDAPHAKDEDAVEDMDMEMNATDSAPVQTTSEENGDDANAAADTSDAVDAADASPTEMPSSNAEASSTAVAMTDTAGETELKGDESSQPQAKTEGSKEDVPGVEAVVESGNEPESQDADETMEESPALETEESAMNHSEARELPTKEESRVEVSAETQAPPAPKADDAEVEKPRFELPYSTRGRQNAREGSDYDVSSRGYRDNTSDAGQDAASDIGVGRLGDGVAPGASFLESLSEEERRLRTRYLPDVDGIRMLHKSEIKGDLSLARSIMSSAGTVSSVKKAKGRKTAQSKSSDEDRMDVEEEEGNGQSEDDRASDISSRPPGGVNVALESRDLSILSAAFVAPPENSVVPLNGDTGDGQGSVSAPKRWQGAKSSLIVESITAFNPPRPPESVGPKQKNRMLRWERRPQDVEHDLRATRKTVQKTREELHRAERERERVETVGSVLRTHFLNHLKAIKNESIQLNEELAATQVDCVKAADLLTSRTRSRGVGKSVYVMRDVITVLKHRGASLNDKQPLPSKTEPGKSPSGVGGVSSVSFVDWDGATNILPNRLAESWILPGDKVETPYGEGVAMHVYGPSKLDVNEPPIGYARPKPRVSSKESAKNASQGAKATEKEALSEKKVESSDSNSHGFGSSGQAQATEPSSDPSKDTTEPKETTNGDPGTPGQVKSSPKATESKSGSSESKNEESKATKKSKPSNAAVNKSPTVAPNEQKPLEHILLPRVCVRLPFGTGFFPLDAVKLKEDPSTYSDAMLSSRWKKMVNVASTVGSCIDVAAMEFSTEEDASGRTNGENDSDEASGGSRLVDSDRMEVVAENPSISPPNGPGQESKEFGGDKGDHHSTEASLSDTTGENKGARCRFVPLGAGMLATASSRGALLPDTPIDSLEKGLHLPFYEFSEILGRPNNSGVPEGVKNWEDQRYETCILQAKVFQLRNELYRQRRIRLLNERTFVTSRDRSHRVEHLLAEMRSDLKSLKDRLEDELYELGIDEETAGNLMASYYKEKENTDFATIDATPPPKRKRRLPKEQPRLEPKQTRRRAADAAEDSMMFGQGGESQGADAGLYDQNDKLSGRFSGDEMGIQSSDDDMDSRRANKRARVAA